MRRQLDRYRSLPVCAKSHLLVIVQNDTDKDKGRTEYVIEKVAVVFVRVEAVVDVNVGGKARVEVAEVQLAVKGQKDVVCPYYDYESAF